MLIIACTLTLFVILVLTSLMIKPVEKEETPPQQLPPTALSKRLPAQPFVMNNETPWYMKKLEDNKK